MTLNVRLQHFGVLFLAIILIGCTPVNKKRGQSPLQKVMMSPDCVALDIYYVPMPAGDETIEARLWQELDEQSISPERRIPLLSNGIRVGLASGLLSGPLVELLQIEGKPVSDGSFAQAPLEKIADKPGVMHRHLQLHFGREGEIVATESWDDLPLIVADQKGHVHGKTYFQAQPIFTVEVEPETDGRVRLRLTPELQYGQVRQRWTGGQQSALRLESGRETETFDEYVIESILAPGEMLVAGDKTSQPGSLGYHFFNEPPTAEPQRKLLIIRVSQTQHDDITQVAVVEGD